MKLFFLVTLLMTLGACSDKPMVVNARDAEFYNRFVNSSDSFENAEKEISNLKLIQTGSDYAMRYVLFDNKKFYYQIDRLGSGTGTWKYSDGAITLTASRPMFDLDIYLSAEKPEGDDLVLRFLDRHGFNSIRGHAREPEIEEPLKDFIQSPKDI